MTGLLSVAGYLHTESAKNILYPRASELYQGDRPANNGNYTISFDGDDGGYFPLWLTAEEAQRVADRYSKCWPEHTYVVIKS